jgi:hypothetical protein
MTVYEKRGMWKVAGSSKKYATRQEAEAAAGLTHYEAKEAFYDSFEEEVVDGDIEEELDNESAVAEGELSESPDSGLFGALGD